MPNRGDTPSAEHEICGNAFVRCFRAQGRRQKSLAQRQHGDHGFDNGGGAEGVAQE